jgi:NADPH:quinone reductase-like Zn-dependent oxidoreductase
MKAIGFYRPLPIDTPDALVDIDLPAPELQSRDLLVRVQAISVNPADVKLRAGVQPPQGEARILGYDAVGIVEATGPDARVFRKGDAVFYAGAIDRPGTYAELHAVDERIVGPKPASLDPAHAAALPLTALTAWELLFDRLGVARSPTTRS